MASPDTELNSLTGDTSFSLLTPKRISCQRCSSRHRECEGYSGPHTPCKRCSSSGSECMPQEEKYTQEELISYIHFRNRTLSILHGPMNYFYNPNLMRLNASRGPSRSVSRSGKERKIACTACQGRKIKCTPVPGGACETCAKHSKSCSLAPSSEESRGRGMPKSENDYGDLTLLTDQGLTKLIHNGDFNLINNAIELRLGFKSRITKDSDYYEVPISTTEDQDLNSDPNDDAQSTSDHSPQAEVNPAVHAQLTDWPLGGEGAHLEVNTSRVYGLPVPIIHVQTPRDPNSTNGGQPHPAYSNDHKLPHGQGTQPLGVTSSTSLPYSVPCPANQEATDWNEIHTHQASTASPYEMTLAEAEEWIRKNGGYDF